MSTLAEIEAAVESLSSSQQKELLAFLTERIGRDVEGETASGDAFMAVIGAFAGPAEPTGRRAEEILYGPRT